MQIGRKALEVLCQAHHEVRTKQGFTTAEWSKLEERNRQQYRDAMKAALSKLPTPEQTEDIRDAVEYAIQDASDIDGISPSAFIRSLEAQGLCIVSISERSLMLLGRPEDGDLA